MSATVTDDAIDLFGGAGGWDLPCKVLGFNPLGIEIDDAACATREAAGLRTLQANVASLHPPAYAPCELLVGSPPCPTFSSAGNGGGRHLTDLCVRCLHELAAGNDTRSECREEAYPILFPAYWEKEVERAAKKRRQPDRQKVEARARRDADMSLLVVEPLRWVLALEEPRWIALEQVPEVLGLWSETAAILGTLGYSTWTGVLSAEQYGVPQTRKRAILVADREAPVSPPPPTHARYVKPKKEREEPGLFEVPREVERIVLPEDRHLLPWVSMAEVLGWDQDDEVGFPRADDSGGEGYRDRDRRPASEPAFTLGEKARSWDRVVYRNGNQTNAAERSGDEPAPTIHFGKALNQVEWVYDRPAPTRRSKDGVLVGRQLPPGEGENVGGHNWPSERPSTTVNGDPRISKPGRHDPEESGSQQKDAIRVSLEEAAIFQSFPPGYPFQGTKSQRFLQVGNAVPPLLAHAILSSLLPEEHLNAPEEAREPAGISGGGAPR